MDHCLSSPCGNGTCVSHNDSFSCQCPIDGRLYDEVCQLVDPCASSPCYGNATCIGDTSNGTFSCHCGHFYGGDLCNEEVNECISRNITCLNGGVCIVLFGDFTCDCPMGFIGRFCKNYGCVNMCMNNGSCTEGVDGYTCRCMPGFTGPRCNQTVTSCLDDPCVGNSSCINDYDASNRVNFSCICLPGYTGVLCDIDIDECQSTPCLNGATCVDGVNNFTCACEAGFTGETCDAYVNECLGRPCGNGGTCIDGILSFTCLCATNYTGLTCQVSYNFYKVKKVT